MDQAAAANQRSQMLKRGVSTAKQEPHGMDPYNAASKQARKPKIARKKATRAQLALEGLAACFSHKLELPGNGLLHLGPGTCHMNSQHHQQYAAWGKGGIFHGRVGTGVTVALDINPGNLRGGAAAADMKGLKSDDERLATYKP